MELDILHRAVSPEIVEFYGAFFVESCVYYCMELMVSDRVFLPVARRVYLTRLSGRWKSGAVRAWRCARACLGQN